MPRPATFEEYLASLVPPSVRGLDRRTLLTGGVALSALTLAGCGGSDSTTTSGSTGTASGSGGSTAAATGEVTLGSN